MSGTKPNAAAIVACIFLLSFPSLASPNDEVEKARLGRVMWSAFQCFTFADISKNEKERTRLFQVGLKAGRGFLEALNSGQISEKTVREEVPIGVTIMLQGPSIDFILGRIFEGAMSDAYDYIVKQANGMPLETSQWIMDGEVKKMKAEITFLKNNCALVK
jgi:hypothetical protein